MLRDKEESPMKKLSIFIGLFFVLSVGVLPAAAITWGDSDTEHTNVGVMLIEHPVNVYFPICSGTLIHPRVFLTAGHCTDGLEGSEAYVRVNFDQDALNPSSLLAVEEVITHPEYYWGPQSNPHDVGILVLAEPGTDIEPAELQEVGFLDDLRVNKELNRGANKPQFTVVGYGGTLDWPPPDITFDNERQFAVSEFRALLKAWLRLSQNQATGDGGSCYGDSGGPAFWIEEDGTKILVGITSWGDTPCVATGFNYRVDIPETLGFIDDVIDNLP
jgi:hypothetical protein